MIYLIGYMGVGKSFIGRKLSLEINIPFFDTDTEIERKEGKAIEYIFRENGENYFRKLETNILKKVRNQHIVACGGGLPIYNNNMQFINNTGKSIYLEASADFLYHRLNKERNSRPLISSMDSNLKESIEEQIKKRDVIYKEAQYTINIENKRINQILREINTFL